MSIWELRNVRIWHSLRWSCTLPLHFTSGMLGEILRSCSGFECYFNMLKDSSKQQIFQQGNKEVASMCALDPNNFVYLFYQFWGQQGVDYGNVTCGINVTSFVLICSLVQNLTNLGCRRMFEEVQGCWSSSGTLQWSSAGVWELHYKKCVKEDLYEALLWYSLEGECHYLQYLPFICQQKTSFFWAGHDKASHN